MPHVTPAGYAPTDPWPQAGDRGRAPKGRWVRSALPRRCRRARRHLVGAVLPSVAVATLPGAPAASLAPRQPLWSAADGREVAITALTRDGDDAYTVIPTARASGWTPSPPTPTRTPGSSSTAPPARSSPTGRAAPAGETGPGRSCRPVPRCASTRSTGRCGPSPSRRTCWVSPFTFNVHTWDTSRPGRPFELVGQVDMRERFFAYGFVRLPVAVLRPGRGGPGGVQGVEPGRGRAGLG